jgi:hypothetical protein
MIILQKLNALQLSFVVRIHLISDIFKHWKKYVWTKKTPMAISLMFTIFALNLNPIY